MSSFAGHLALRAAVRDHGRTVLAAQSFRAPFHLSKPYWDADTRCLLVQVVNPTAGILAGDQLDANITVEAGASLLVTTPSASRIFCMRDGAAKCRQQFHVAAKGWLEVMPESLVPHRGSRYEQVTTIDVEPDGALFFVDPLMPGRLGHGEAWAWERLRLDVTVRVGGELVLRELFQPSGAELAQLAQLAGSGGSSCFANAVLISTCAIEAASSWRAELAALHRETVWLGVSALRRCGWSIKIVTANALALRQTLRDVRRILAPYFPRLGCDPRKL